MHGKNKDWSQNAVQILALPPTPNGGRHLGDILRLLICKTGLIASTSF